jgi:hypothetical protein
MSIFRGGTLRRRCEDVLNDIEIPAPWSLDRFLALLSERRNRPIILAQASVPCGQHISAQWWKQPEADVILYAKTQSTFYKELSVLHEVGHMLCGHDRGAASLSGPFTDADLTEITCAPAAAAVIFSRNSRFDSVEEQEAELTAYRLKVMIERSERLHAPLSDLAAPRVVHVMRRAIGSEVSR